MTEYCRFGDFSVHREIDKIVDGFTIHQNWIYRDGIKFLTLSSLEDCKDVANVLSVYAYNNECLEKQNEQLKQQLNEVKAHNNWLIAVLEESGAIVELKKGDVE